MLELQIKSMDFELTGDIDAYVRERASALDRIFEPIATLRVIMEAPVGHHRQGGPFTVRIEADVPGKLLSVSHREDANLHVAIRSSFEAAERELREYARQLNRQVKTHEEPLRGHVLRVFTDRGYGFLAAADGHEVYFHENSVLKDGFHRLEPGSVVRFVEEAGDKGPQASTVEAD
jgi:cold shock CspA family protein/ribosome-associated translation inhibitor RaiA